MRWRVSVGRGSGFKRKQCKQPLSNLHFYLLLLRIYSERTVIPYVPSKARRHIIQSFSVVFVFTTSSAAEINQAWETTWFTSPVDEQPLLTAYENHVRNSDRPTNQGKLNSSATSAREFQTATRASDWNASRTEIKITSAECSFCQFNLHSVKQYFKNTLDF